MIWFIAIGILIPLAIMGEWKLAWGLFIIFLILFLINLWIFSYVPR